MKTPALYVAAAFFTATAFAAPPPQSAPTNSLASEMEAYVRTNAHRASLEHSATSRRFWSVLRESFTAAVDRNAENSFDLPAGRLHWTSSAANGYAVHDQLNSAGRSLFTSSLRHGGLEAIGDYLPTDEWADWAADTFHWSFDARERELTYAKASPSAADLEWSRDNDRLLHLGVDPFGLALFGKATIGRNGKSSLTGDQPLAILGLRYEYDPRDQGRLKGELVIPLPYSWQFHASCSVDGENIANANPNSFDYAIRVERYNRTFKNLFYIGMQSHQGFLPRNERSSGPALASGLEFHF